MTEHALGIVGQHAINLCRGIPAMSKQEFKSAFASWQGFHVGGLGRVKPHCFFHGALLYRRCAAGGGTILIFMAVCLLICDRSVVAVKGAGTRRVASHGDLDARAVKAHVLEFTIAHRPKLCDRGPLEAPGQVS
jgi:hypothetical protein